MVDIIKKAKNIIENKPEPLTAERAWLETTYGRGQYKSLEKRIKAKQDDISDIIKSNFGFGTINSRSYRCVVDIEDDLKNHTETIFEPFISGGFKVINLSDSIKELKGEAVYLISWKDVVF